MISCISVLGLFGLTRKIVLIIRGYTFDCKQILCVMIICLHDNRCATILTQGNLDSPLIKATGIWESCSTLTADAK